MSWLNEKTVIYQIFIDRFARPQSDTRVTDTIPDTEPVFCGGNIRGIIEHFDHIKGLGVTALWISPFYKGDAFHGYHTTDLMVMDERFGTEADLRELIDLAHANQMKIVADFVPNHISSQHPYFIEARSKSDSAYREWFYFSKYPNKYLCFLDIDILPKLNLDYPPARAHVIAAARKWLQLGLDGFRLDHIPGPSNDFWKEFLSTLRSEFPSAEFFGEAWMFGVKFSQLKTLRVSHKYLSWMFGTRFLMSQYLGLFPALLDFDFNQLIRAYAGGTMKKERLMSALGAHFTRTQGTAMITFLDNHDMDRICFVAYNNIEVLKDAAQIQFSLPHPVVIYQGTEFAMTHERGMASYASYGDMVARKMIPWGDGDGTLFDFYRELINKKTH
jgi:glycosidase